MFLIHFDGKTWSVTNGPTLYQPVGIAAPTRRDVWVVGASRTILHWNGTDWSRIALPKARGVQLTSVSASAPDNVWVVGQRYGVRLPANSVGSHTLAYRFDGHRWSIVPTPNPDYAANSLTAVMSISDTYTLVAGFAGEDGYTLQWDGATWRQASLPAPEHHLHVIVVGLGMAGTQPWAVGATGGPGFGNPVYLKWTGALWQLVPMKAIDYNTPTAQSVSGGTPFDVWAVGAANGGRYVLAHTTNARAFEYVQLPVPAQVDPNEGSLNAVRAFSPDDVWAVGVATTISRSPCATSSGNLALVDHWDGHSWTPVHIPGLASVRP
ncbi:MAG TPA: hypothetical protein VHC43_02745 [Mycobacteriales bacterium]|nr:hypothetical protein [Mycobacteriales bacterium]